MDTRTLYDEDIYAWAEQQAAALRRAAASGRVQSNELDLENLAEEIQDVGKSELRATTSYLFQAFAHLAKLAGDPGSQAGAHWDGEVRRFLRDARKSYSPGMRRLIDVEDAWRDGVRHACADLLRYGLEYVPVYPRSCPFSLDELLDGNFDVREAVSRLRAPSAKD